MATLLRSTLFSPPLIMDSPHRSAATSVSRSTVPVQSADTDNPCLHCGACCAHFRVSFYCGELSGENGGWVPIEFVTQLTPLRACMKGTEMGHDRCIALRGELGKPGIHCAIYEQRPSPCREFDAWLPDGQPNPECQALRRGLGLSELTEQVPLKAA